MSTTPGCPPTVSLMRQIGGAGVVEGHRRLGSAGQLHEPRRRIQPFDVMPETSEVPRPSTGGGADVEDRSVDGAHPALDDLTVGIIGRDSLPSMAAGSKSGELHAWLTWSAAMGQILTLPGGPGWWCLRRHHCPSSTVASRRNAPPRGSTRGTTHRCPVGSSPVATVGCGHTSTPTPPGIPSSRHRSLRRRPPPARWFQY